MSASAFLTAHDVADETGLSYDAVRRAIACGELKATKIRRRILVRRDWFDTWIDAHVLAPSTPAVVEHRPLAAAPARGAPGSLERLRAIERGAL